MPKLYAKIGYAETVEIEPGIWEEQITVKSYYADFTRNTRRLQVSQDSVNSNVDVSNEISIVADPYASQNFFKMRYVEFMGAKWKINTVDVRYPRLILSIGGLYNGGPTGTSE